MGCTLQHTCFDALGYPVDAGSRTLPDSLDWKSLEEKEVFIRYIGGLHPDSVYCLIVSQGQKRLITDLSDSTGPTDHHIFKEKMSHVEDYLNRRCSELGIDRTAKPRNQ